jgi:hypothetical protein
MHRQQKHPLLHFLLSVALVAGCASRPEPLKPQLRQQLGKVYLNSAGTTGDTFFHADFAKGGAGGALKGAGKGALAGLDDCAGSAMSGGELGPLVFLVCAPLAIPASMFKGSAAGSKAAIPEETLSRLEEQANVALQTADLSPALVATLDDVSQQEKALAQYEISHGTLPAPENNESISDVAARWDYQTVMDVEVIKAGFDSDNGRVPMMHFTMTAQIKLIDTKSGSVLQKQDYSYNSSPQPLVFWFSDNFGGLAREIVKANQKLANNILSDVFIK